MSHNHGSMSGMTSSCEMNMVGNWATSNICVLTSSWHVKTSAEFAGTCIGIFLIVFLIETVRRWGREFDRWIIENAALQRREKRRANRELRRKIQMGLVSEDVSEEAAPKTIENLDSIFFGLPKGTSRALQSARFRPTMLQQVIRSLVYGIQFTGAYLVMLMAMTFNGFILISIIFGGIFGHFFSTWDTLAYASANETDELDHDYTTKSVAQPPADSKDDDSDASSIEAQKLAKRQPVGVDDHEIYGSGACCG